MPLKIILKKRARNGKNAAIVTCDLVALQLIKNWVKTCVYQLHDITNGAYAVFHQIAGIKTPAKCYRQFN